MLSPGQAIDRYTVDRLLGQGGMAVVYRVTHNQLGSWHALKILTLTSPTVRDRLLQEGRVQASLRHPNIVAVTDVLTVDGAPGLVMEYVEGPSLEDFLAENRPDADEAERLFRAIVSAVQHAHAQGLVHRDLKPANVLLAPASGTFVPKVADFGLAKALADEGGGLKQTRSGVAMGTPAYMAPEQIRDAKNVDARADLFSLGCILYELATGRPAFSGPDVLSIFNAVASGSFAPVRSLVPDLPPHLQAAIDACLVVDRERRVADCDALLRVLDGERFHTPAPSAPAPSGGETWSGEELLTPAGGGELAVATETRVAPRSAPSDPLDATLEPPAPSSLSGSLPGATRKVGALLGVGAVGLGVLVVGLGGAAIGGWMWLDSRVEARMATFLRNQTAGEVTVGDVGWRPGGAVLSDVAVVGADGAPVATARAVHLQGDLSGRSWDLRSVRIDGLALDLRRTDAGWVLPDRTAALFAGRIARDIPFSAEVDHLATGPVTIRATTPDGTLSAGWSALDLSDLALDLDGGFSWQAGGASVADLALDDALTVSAGTFADGVLALEGLAVDLSLGEDGRPELPVVVADRFADWAGGTLRDPVDAPWAGLHVGWLPVRPDKLEVRSGTVRLHDSAHATEPVTWELTVEHARVGPRAGDRLPVSVGGRAVVGQGSGTFGVDGDLSEEGLFRARATLGGMPLRAVSPYFATPLSRYGVEVADGTVDGALSLSIRGHAFAGALDATLDAPRLVKAPPVPGQGTESPGRLLDARETVAVDGAYEGDLTDADFSPVEDVLDDLSDALFAPASARPARRTSPARPASTRDRGGAMTRPTSSRSTRPRTDASRPSRPDGAERPGADRSGDGDRDAPDRRETLDRWNRDVRDALEDLRGMRR